MDVVNSFVRARSAGTSTPVRRSATMTHGPAVQEDGDEDAQANRSLEEQQAWGILRSSSSCARDGRRLWQPLRPARLAHVVTPGQNFQDFKSAAGTACHSVRRGSAGSLGLHTCEHCRPVGKERRSQVLNRQQAGIQSEEAEDHRTCEEASSAADHIQAVLEAARHPGLSGQLLDDDVPPRPFARSPPPSSWPSILSESL
jgi:hypothetical protein